MWCFVATLGALKLSAEAVLECYLYALTCNGVVSKTPEHLLFVERFINILTVGEHSEKQATHTYLFLIWNVRFVHAKVWTPVWFSLIDVLSPSFGHCVALHLNRNNKSHLISEGSILNSIV